MAKKPIKKAKKGRKRGPKEERLVIPPEQLGATIDRLMTPKSRQRTK